MKHSELILQIQIELANMGATARELIALRRDLADRQPTNLEKTAAATFLAQFYTGVENILKRLSRFHNVQLLTGDTWHTDLFKRFCDPAFPPLPLLFDAVLAAQLGAFRKFRHVVFHGYGFQIEWDRMKEGIEQVIGLLARFETKVMRHLADLEKE